jgi:hypothetical protein
VLVSDRPSTINEVMRYEIYFIDFIFFFFASFLFLS